MSKTTQISSSINASLLNSLYRARKNIEKNKDIYMDAEHELLCESYKKYREAYINCEELSKQLENDKIKISIKYEELSKQLDNDKIKIEYNTFKIDKHILSDSHDIPDEIIYMEYTLEYEVFYNKYNKKFINNLYVLTNPRDYEEWIEEQNRFIKSLTPEEIYTLRCHTQNGDIIINYFIINNMKIDKDIDIVGGNWRKQPILIIKKDILNSNRNYILFYYQIKEYLYKRHVELSKLSRIELEEYIKKNYKDFDWNSILLLYIRDINNIFKKCPDVKKTLVIYRGTSDDYYLKKSSKGIHTVDTLTSHTLNPKVAVGYSSGGDCCVMRVKLSKGSKAILIDNISSNDDAELLIPFNTKYYIDYARHSINYYSDSYVICPDEARPKKLIVTDLSTIPPRQLSTRRSS
jgi:hypothetical protein